MPIPLPVEVVSDPLATILAVFSALVALAAAIFSAVAAIQAAKATRTARDAYMSDLADRRIQQAQHVFAHLDTRPTDANEHRAHVNLQNTSDGFIFDIDISVEENGVEVFTLARREVFARGVSSSEAIELTRPAATLGDAFAVVRFTDYAGVRWERRSSYPPREIG